MSRGDKVLIFLVGVIGLAGLGKNFYPFLVKNLSQQFTPRVEIFYQGKFYGSYSLAADQKFSVGPAVVSIQNQQVRIIQNNCPNQLCVRSGAIKYPGQSIICTPNKILITIVSPQQKIDSLSY